MFCFLFLLTEQLKNTFDVGIEFKLDYITQYEDLEHPTTKTLVKRIEDSVSNNLRLSEIILFCGSYELNFNLKNDI